MVFRSYWTYKSLDLHVSLVTAHIWSPKYHTHFSFIYITQKTNKLHWVHKSPHAKFYKFKFIFYRVMALDMVQMIKILWNFKSFLATCVHFDIIFRHLYNWKTKNDYDLSTCQRKKLLHMFYGVIGLTNAQFDIFHLLRNIFDHQNIARIFNF